MPREFFPAALDNDVNSALRAALTEFERLGATVPKGILLHGPPGTGKTSIGASIARNLGRKFFRLSLGGMLALQLAAEQSVAAVIALSTPYTIPADWRVALLRQISHVHPYMKKTSATASWVDPQALQRRVQYGVRPLRAMAEVVDYLRVLPELLPAVTAPALLIHSNADRAVTPADMQRICDRLGSHHKEMLLLARGDHVITEDVERAQVFAAVEKFLAQQMPA